MTKEEGRDAITEMAKTITNAIWEISQAREKYDTAWLEEIQAEKVPGEDILRERVMLEIAIATCLVGEGTRWLINPRNEPDGALVVDATLSTRNPQNWKEKIRGLAAMLTHAVDDGPKPS